MMIDMQFRFTVCRILKAKYFHKTNSNNKMHFGVVNAYIVCSTVTNSNGPCICKGIDSWLGAQCCIMSSRQVIFAHSLSDNAKCVRRMTHLLETILDRHSAHQEPFLCLALVAEVSLMEIFSRPRLLEILYEK
jgi:hypothetical protein